MQRRGRGACASTSGVRIRIISKGLLWITDGSIRRQYDILTYWRLIKPSVSNSPDPVKADAFESQYSAWKWSLGRPGRKISGAEIAELGVGRCLWVSEPWPECTCPFFAKQGQVTRCPTMLTLQLTADDDWVMTLLPCCRCQGRHHTNHRILLNYAYQTIRRDQDTNGVNKLLQGVAATSGVDKNYSSYIKKTTTRPIDWEFSGHFTVIVDQSKSSLVFLWAGCHLHSSRLFSFVLVHRVSWPTDPETE